MGKNLKALLMTTTCMSIGMGFTPAFAQEQQGQAVLDEIVVTANKREENINTVGVTITAMSAESLENRQITNPTELASIIPGLALAPSSHSTPVYTLRGVGYNADALAVYPAVSIYMDQAPMPFPVLGTHSLFDLERVEVLKGPQGTMFGQNSTGGAINYIAAKPTQEAESGFEVGYGRFNEFTASGFVSGPLSDTVGVRFAMDMKRRGDWQENYTRDDSNGSQEYFAGRFILEANPNDNFSISLNVNGSIDHSDPQAKQLIAVIPSNKGIPSVAEATMPLVPDGDIRAADWSIDTRNNSTPPTGDRKLFQASLRMDYDISEAMTITSLTTYNRLSQNPVTDLDGSSAEFADNPKDIGEMKTFNQELRLSNVNEVDTKLRWTVGANYDKSDVAEDQWITYADNSLSNAANIFINNSGIDSTADIENYAFFGNAEYDLTDKLTLRGGARYTKSKNLTELCGYSPGDGRVAELFTIIGFLFTGTTVPLTGEDCYTLNDSFLPGDPFVYDLTEDNVSWKAGLDYHVNDDTLVYVNVSRGYKTGSFPAITAAVQSALIPAKQEAVTSYELGTKATLMDGAMQVNGAVFYQDYKDKQIQGTLNDLAFGLLQQLQNVPKSRIAGAEIDLMYRPTQALTISASASYLDTKVTEFEGGDFLGFPQNFAGDKLPFAPKWTFILDADYRVPVGNAGNEVFFGATLNHRTSADAYIGASRIPLPTDRTDIRALSTHPFVIDGYTLVDARFGYDMPEKGMRVTAWAKNMFNEFYASNLVSNNDVIMRLTGQPASYGITVGFQF